MRMRKFFQLGKTRKPTLPYWSTYDGISPVCEDMYMSMHAYTSANTYAQTIRIHGFNLI